MNTSFDWLAMICIAAATLLAMTVHEAAHGFAAYHFGDRTAYRRGRLTFNPLAHIDPFGTVMLPLFLLIVHSPFLFGYAKPIPVQPSAFRNPRRDMALVAAAGPASNLALAILFAAIAWLTSWVGAPYWLSEAHCTSRSRPM